MAITQYVGSGDAAVSNGGTTTIDTAGFGQPDLAIVTVTRASSYDARGTHSVLCWGAFDGTTQACASVSGEAGVNTNTASYLDDTAICAFLDPTVNDPLDTLEVDATVAWATNGITITWNTAPSTAYKVTAALFKGLNCKVGTHRPAQTPIDSTTSVSGLSFTPVQAIIVGAGNAEFNETAAATARISIGLADKDDGQASANWGFHDNQGAIPVADWFDTNDVRKAVHGFGASGTPAYRITTWNSDGWTMAIKDNTTVAPNYYEHIYVALEYNGGSHGLVTDTTKTTTGTKANTGFTGFTPAGIFFATSWADAADTELIINSGAISFGYSASGGGEMSAGCGADKGGNLANCFISNTKSVRLEGPHTADADVAGDVQSFDSGGFTMDYTAVNGTARYFAAMGWADDGTVNDSITPDYLTATSTVYDANIDTLELFPDALSATATVPTDTAVVLQQDPGASLGKTITFDTSATYVSENNGAMVIPIELSGTHANEVYDNASVSGFMVTNMAQGQLQHWTVKWTRDLIRLRVRVPAVEESQTLQVRIKMGGTLSGDQQAPENVFINHFAAYPFEEDYE